MKNQIERAIEMLNVAADYIGENWPDGRIKYDGEWCDGYCVEDDCKAAADGLKDIIAAFFGGGNE